MKKIIFGTLILCLSLFLAFLSFFIPRKIIVESLLSNSPINKEEILPAEEKKPYYLKNLKDIKESFILSDTNFLEVNLSEMKIRIWQDGLLAKEAPILTKGDPQGWGGSAAGLYRIISGNKLSFSIISDVYMPYALHYYGKYYLHGEPYYSWGEKLDSSISGGCLRLSDEDAKIIYELTELDMPVLVIDKEQDYHEYSEEKPSKFPEVSAASFLVADLDSDLVFTEKDSQKQFPIASLTKLITALIVAENVDLRKSILVKLEMLEAYGSTEGLEAGKRFRVVELFYPLLIESSNDAAEVLSHFLGKEKTIKLMNEKAKAILMTQTNFVGPSGFDSQNVSTAQDLFYLARYILNNRPPLLEITKGEMVRSFGEVKFEIENFWNKNIFINDSSFLGGKTGFLPEAEQTALFIFRFINEQEEERNIAILLLGSKNSKTDAQKIYIWLQENYFKL
ncbi:L,D-transpeptidase family protein [Patescibacteria group bacterium]|nr:L,D-transpeptidase family protein [Patescibacteria group bacterium]